MEGKVRYALLDSIRGIVLISMILYHACWDLVYLLDRNWSWYRGTAGYVWQQSICWTFILLSGFCWSLGKKHLRRGLLVLGSGILVTLVTCVFIYEERAVFGVLTLIGSSMLLMIPLEKGLRKVPAAAGLLVSLLLFVLTRNVNMGWLGFEEWNWIRLPEILYRGLVGSYLGFRAPGFFSTDYFSLIPWLFLFVTGYFLFRLCMERGACDLPERYLKKEIKPLAFSGRHSLLIYLLHQPVLFGVFSMMQGLEFL